MKPWSVVEQRKKYRGKKNNMSKLVTQVSTCSGHVSSMEVGFTVNRSFQEVPPSRHRRTLVEVSRRDIKEELGEFGYHLGWRVRGERERGNSDGGPIAEPLLTNHMSSDFVLQAVGNPVGC